MSGQPDVIMTKRMATPLKTDVIGANEFELVYQDRSNYWDQLRVLLRNQRWTTQDEATLNLLQEMPNSHTVFAVRKADDVVLGGINVVETDNFIYGNCYVLREEYRAAGLGIRMIKKIDSIVLPKLKEKGMVGRAVKPMWRAYINRPMNAVFCYDMHYARFDGVDDLVQFFPSRPVHNYRIATMKEVLKNPSMLQAVTEYDTFVTGQDRSKFIRDYYSIDFVEGWFSIIGAVLFDTSGNVKAMAGLVPTGRTNGQYKLNPIYASNPEDAAIVSHAVSLKAKEKDPVFLIHIRAHSAGEWILDKCKATGRPLVLVGATISVAHWPRYRDRSRREFIFAPTNSPAHFDG